MFFCIAGIEKWLAHILGVSFFLSSGLLDSFRALWEELPGKEDCLGIQSFGKILFFGACGRVNMGMGRKVSFSFFRLYLYFIFYLCGIYGVCNWEFLLVCYLQYRHYCI